LAITGFFWLWGDLKFEKKKKDEKIDYKDWLAPDNEVKHPLVH
jgi:hypothetical protein